MPLSVAKGKWLTINVAITKECLCVSTCPVLFPPASLSKLANFRDLRSPEQGELITTRRPDAAAALPEKKRSGKF